MANIIIEVVLKMSFLILSNANIQFAEKELTRKFYTTKEALPTIRQVKLINKKEFAKMPLNENVEVFVVHVAPLKMAIYPAQKAQIALFITEKVTMLAKYSDFADVYSKQSAKVLPKHTGINKHTIKLEEGK